MNYHFNKEELEFLVALARFRVKDESEEVKDLIECHRDEWLSTAQHRLNVWKRILAELTKDGSLESEIKTNDTFR